MGKIRIDLFADIACPWCYIGEARLEQALAQHADLEVERHWHPYQLTPDVPPEGIPWSTFVEAKFGSMEQAGTMFARVAQVAEEEGLRMNFDAITVSPNTRDAHRLILMAGDGEEQMAVAKAVFKAYFADGANVSDRETLISIAGAIGLKEDNVRTYLESDQGNEVVTDSQREAERLGISGVPFFIINERYGISGAQPVETFLRAIERAMEEQIPMDGRTS